MKCNVKSSASERVFQISGAFTALDEDAFFDVFLAIKSMPEPALVFDLSKCSDIDPSAMGMLTVVCEEAGKRNIERRIKNAPKKIKDLLLMAKLDNIYDIT